MKLIVGLGNPGRVHAGNRHNAGFICLAHFVREQDIHLNKKQGKARIGTGEVDDSEVVIAKPQTYMNRSGQAVSPLIEELNLSPEDLIVIHDDLDLPLGKIRIRQGGSSGGHKGINSIITELGSQDFIRVRVGIGRPARDEDSLESSEDEVISYVLSDFDPNEKIVFAAQVIPRVSEAILCLLSDGMETAMNRFN